MTDVKILLFCATKKGLKYLEYFLENDLITYLSGVISFKEKNVKDQYYEEIKDLSQKNNLLFYDWKTIKNRIEPFIKETDTTHIILISWGYLLPQKITRLLKSKMIVYHDSLLPKYRGFSPLPSALINGEKFFGFSVILAEEEMDKGNILLQKKFLLRNDIYINEAIDFISKEYARTIPELIALLKNNSSGKEQNDEEATYSIWRDIDDMQVDWSQSSEEIYNFIRALGPPYLGAYSFLNGEKIYIYKSQVIEEVNFEIRNPGKIWKINNDEAFVVCGKGILKIFECYTENKEKLYFKKLKQRFY
jgi:methionyl-tRNA formyltransferase